MAMSRALGAAFLNHQVEQLEKSVSANSPSSGNWRDRKNIPTIQDTSPPQYHKRTPMAPGIKIVHRKNGSDTTTFVVQERSALRERFNSKFAATENSSLNPIRQRGDSGDNDADIIIVDASVLVHALYQLKKWSRDGRKEIIIVPLEGILGVHIIFGLLLTQLTALNTLDLLKKGISPLAQRARAASRVLEAQVGTNPRVRVQNDEAFVLWDQISMKDVSSDDEVEPRAPHSPEWVRRTICCARWEVDNADATMRSAGNGRSAANAEGENMNKEPRVALAVLSGPYHLSPSNHTLRLADSNDNSMTPVPLPAPSVPHTNRFEVRSSGVLVAKWAEKAGINILSVEPTLPGRGAAIGNDEDERPKRVHHSHHGSKGRRASNADHPQPPKACLVERPPAVMAMMEAVSQPRRVVRVLARGEKLDP